MLGSTLMWNLGSGTPAEIIEAARDVWQFRCDVFNGDKTSDDFDSFMQQKEEEKAAAEAAAAEAAEAAAEEAAE